MAVQSISHGGLIGYRRYFLVVARLWQAPHAAPSFVVAACITMAEYRQTLSLSPGRARLHFGHVYQHYSDASGDHKLIAYDAMFDSRAEEHKARCLDNTRVDLLRQIGEWADDPAGNPSIG